MRLALVVVTAVCACSQPQRSPPSAPAAPADPPAPNAAPAAGAPAAAHSPISAEVFCANLVKLSNSCPGMEKMRTDTEHCMAIAHDGIAAADKDPMVAAFIRCTVENDQCDGFGSCFKGASDAIQQAPTLRACDERSSADAGLNPVGIPRAEWEHRPGAGVTTFRGAQSSKQAPIEMCGVTAANQWLISLACDDGSHPIKDIGDAESSRTGNIGEGGRCNSIIDHYVAACPEAHYEIFIDAYVCPQ